MEIMDIMKKRYSLRYFDREREVPADAVSEIIEAARLAPTAHNAQAFHIYQLQGGGLAEAMKPVSNSHFGAPLVLALTMDESKSWKRRDGFDNAAIDIGIVGTHIILRAESLGLGTCWVGSFDPDALRSLLHLGTEDFPAALFMIGYPSSRAKAGPMHDLRKSKEDLLTVIDL